MSWLRNRDRSVGPLPLDLRLPGILPDDWTHALTAVLGGSECNPSPRATDVPGDSGVSVSDKEHPYSCYNSWPTPACIPSVWKTPELSYRQTVYISLCCVAGSMWLAAVLANFLLLAWKIGCKAAAKLLFLQPDTEEYIRVTNNTPAATAAGTFPLSSLTAVSLASSMPIFDPNTREQFRRTAMGRGGGMGRGSRRASVDSSLHKSGSSSLLPRSPNHRRRSGGDAGGGQNLVSASPHNTRKRRASLAPTTWLNSSPEGMFKLAPPSNDWSSISPASSTASLRSQDIELRMTTPNVTPPPYPGDKEPTSEDHKNNNRSSSNTELTTLAPPEYGRGELPGIPRSPSYKLDMPNIPAIVLETEDENENAESASGIVVLPGRDNSHSLLGDETPELQHPLLG